MAWVVLAGALLAVHNVLGNEALPDAAYVPVNLATGAVLIGLATTAGASFDDLGAGRADVPRGLVVGGIVAVVVAAALLIGATLPATRGLFEDQRITGLDGAGLAYQALVRIPLGTALFEELAFRGVLLALLLRITSTGPAVVCSSALFGLWHVLPTISALRINELATGTGARVATVAGAVVVTGIAGALLCALRLGTGSLVAPVIAHTATNSLAIVTAFVVQRIE